ncbi:putative Diguanylate cyclase/phosphodiesterase (GGDEF & EAL domains) with PAS/PAC sensor(S) [Actinacidiphila bryophytorum]|uniref:Diguanylate cyclase/phosphodiesterase (GGDEF & EAL domains) with PAS/PAC sensor(S) n=1 Tax=Actinacidiphila bryophytorum TaxID=1436133 RepID=A0A9W4H4R3_9ACTN|nr:putative Diguanylate cyclase/phosphodiesterase (GGDEF & EAL domains) with PAS/PAC sensor(S) [Actinacidiphila bryophytorum]
MLEQTLMCRCGTRGKWRHETTTTAGAAAAAGRRPAARGAGRARRAGGGRCAHRHRGLGRTALDGQPGRQPDHGAGLLGVHGRTRRLRAHPHRVGPHRRRLGRGRAARRIPDRASRLRRGQGPRLRRHLAGPAGHRAGQGRREAGGRRRPAQGRHPDRARPHQGRRRPARERTADDPAGLRRGVQLRGAQALPGGRRPRGRRPGPADRNRRLPGQGRRTRRAGMHRQSRARRLLRRPRRRRTGPSAGARLAAERRRLPHGGHTGDRRGERGEGRGRRPRAVHRHHRPRRDPLVRRPAGRGEHRRPVRDGRPAAGCAGGLRRRHRAEADHDGGVLLHLRLRLRALRAGRGRDDPDRCGEPGADQGRQGRLRQGGPLPAVRAPHHRGDLGHQPLAGRAALRQRGAAAQGHRPRGGADRLRHRPSTAGRHPEGPGGRHRLQRRDAADRGRLARPAAAWADPLLQGARRLGPAAQLCGRVRQRAGARRRYVLGVDLRADRRVRAGPAAGRRRLGRPGQPALQRDAGLRRPRHRTGDLDQPVGGRVRRGHRPHRRRLLDRGRARP